MTRPALDRNHALELLAPHGIFLVDHPVIALGIRGGLSKTGKNTVGGFDDLLGILTGELCEGFTGNTDPSTEVLGRANLIVGVHWFKPGFHHPDTPKQYPAFVQDGPITVKRFQTEAVPVGTNDSRGECLGGGLWTGEFAIHLHDSMGENTTGSEGCITLIKHEWPPFHTLLFDELVKTAPEEVRGLGWEKLAANGLLKFPVVILEAA